MLKVEMPLLEEGNPKCYHDSFTKYYPMLLMFKEKLGHLRIPGVDPKKKIAWASGLAKEY
jgi:hypothetical protein